MTVLTAPSLGRLCEGLADCLEPLGIQVLPYMSGNVTPPAIEVVPGDEEYHRAMQNGMHEAEFRVRLFVASGAPNRGAMEKLYSFMEPFGAGSVKETIEEGSGLDGLVTGVRVKRRTGPRAFTRPGAPSLIGAEWIVTVYPLIERSG